MCRYRYYYFAGCRHQQTVLFDFCAEAQYIQNEPLGISLGTISHGKNHVEVDCEQAQRRDCDDGKNDGSADTEEDGEGASVVANTNLECILSTTHTQSPHSTNSSFDRGLASIIAESKVDCSSLPADHTSYPSPPVSTSHDMAGTLFGGAFARWISPGASETVDSVEAHSQLQGLAGRPASSRIHPTGIRERTDESCNLTPMSEIIQHLAESCRGVNSQHVGTDGERVPSYGSIDTDRSHRDPVQVKQEEYDNLEAEIDQLKDNITKLREEADRGRTTPKTEQELANDRFLATWSLRGQPKCPVTRLETAAARLQRQHEAESHEHEIARGPCEGVQQPLSPLDFPALDVCKPGLHSTSQTDSQPRKLSYADAITSGMLDANHHAFTAAMAKRADSKVSESSSDEPLSTSTRLSRRKTLSTAATQESQDLSNDREDGNCSIIVSPRSIESVSSTNDPIMVSKSQPSAPNGKPTKSTPHFAQPTQSYSRRKGESIRSPLSPLSPKSAPGSPTKSMRAKEPCLATEKRATQRQQKRKSLPGDWMGAEAQQAHVQDADVPSKAEKTPILTPKKIAPAQAQVSPPSTEGWQKVARRNVKEQVNSNRKLSNQSQSKSPLRSNASGKPVPNNVPKSRIPVTTHTTKTKRGSLPSTPIQLRPEDGDTNRNEPALQRSNTMTSDASSVQFILERESPVLNSAQGQLGSIDRTQPIAVSGTPTQAAALAPVIPPSNVFIGELAQAVPSALSQSRARVEQQPQPVPSQIIAHHVKQASTSGWFPEVSNTTVKRRDSRGHLLTPIMRSLDAKGLLNRTTTNNAMLESYLKCVSAKAFSDSLKEARNSQPNPTSRAPGRRKHISEKSEGSVQSTKARPPHVRNQRVASRVDGHEVVASETSTSVASITQTALNLPGELGARMPFDNNASQNLRVSSLRATAEEFKPTEPASAQSTSMSVEDAIRYWPGHEWDALSSFQRKQICDIRDSFTEHSRITATSMPPPPAFNLQQSLLNMPGRFVGMTPRNGFSQPRSEAGITHTVQAGQVLRRTVSPESGTVRWLLKDINGNETPIKFGRAPPPANSPGYKSSTPTVSSPDSASPWKTPMAYSDRQAMPLAPTWKQATSVWHIRSTQSPARYGWTGGDGKEIKFLGYGPYAERDPNSVVDFDFQGRTSSCHAFMPNGLDEDKENSPVPVKVAPKSQRQWAELLGYQRVPCGNMEITGAVEYCIPFGSQLAGYCHDCMANR